MKSISMLFCGLILLAANAGAQTSFSSSVSLMPSPFAVSAPPSILNLSGASATVQPEPVSFAAFPPAMPAEPAPQGVQGVFVKYDYDVSVGYTFMRFYEVPGDTLNGNGFNVSGVYWYRDWFGPDAEFFAVYSRQTNVNSWVAVAGAGPRVRWVRPRGLDLWAHALIAGAYLAPKSPYGGEGAVAGVVGVGVDLNAHHRHVAYRFAVDGVATHFFGTYQISPKASAGIVFKF
jgi:hypothetical protein